MKIKKIRSDLVAKILFNIERKKGQRGGYKTLIALENKNLI